jgi:tol-pal system protein YbgF
MKSKFKILLTAVFLSSASLVTPALAQSAAEMNVRMMQLEDQIRQLVGQVEQLSFEVQQLKSGMAQAQPQAAPRKKSSNAEPLAPPDSEIQTTNLQPVQPSTSTQGIEQIEDPQSNLVTTVIDENGNEQQLTLQKAPGPQILGTLNGSSAQDDGGFQGQVLVAPGGEAGTQTVAVQPDNDLNSPEALYERSYESLLRRQFPDAEAGFQNFLSKHRNHSLAGNAQYWLGETYYVQGDYRSAAQSFLSGYQEFPKSRKAADSLLKLGLSLKRLGQNEQACAAFGAVSEKYPKSTEARKRAQNEYKRAGC